MVDEIEEKIVETLLVVAVLLSVSIVAIKLEREEIPVKQTVAPLI